MLFTSLVENPNRCLSICSESWGWVGQKNKLSSSHSDAGRLQEYSTIAKRIRDTAADNAGYLKQDGSKPKDLKIIAVYDSEGNLQAGAIVSWHERKNILKIHTLASALWNTTTEKATCIPNVKPVKGAGSAAVFCASQIGLEMAAKAGKESVNIFLEPTDQTVKFYENLGFAKIPNWKPVESGTVCGMAMKVTKESLQKFQAFQKGKGLEESCFVSEDKLPKTQIHFNKMLPCFEAPKDVEWL